MDPTKAVKVSDLTVELDDHVIIDEINFTIDTGTTTVILGPNGAGKSILLKSILRLIPKKSGKVQLFGIDHEQYQDIAPLVSYIPQFVLFDRSFPLTVEGLFTLKSPRPLGMNKTERQRMKELLEMVRMSNYEHKRLTVLSGGQLQRVLLAYSLMDFPKILLLDEPAAGIDVQGQETIYPLLDRIKKEEKLTLVLISHELQIVMQYADQVLCLNKELICAGIPQKVLTNETLQSMYGTEVTHYNHTHSHG